ncbi:oxidoreductase [Lacibacter luteus]|uniref:Oxidoreductase n=1 Tax=Lacibacter luteus TaxID=2508719 RepID=A0A4Q1CFN5_9BACT|nr:oxidoreductase [Lacibacter luteus]RXK58836.1 oxidoreductase [Lacibacter luteus]
MKYFFAFSLLLFVCCVQSSAQTIQLLDSNHTTSIRGLSVVNDNIVWASGANGMIGRSIDGGATFRWNKVDGFAKTDFRDIEAFDANTAIIMGIDTPAVILKTVDGGITWKIVFQDKRAGMFLDAMEFFSNESGMVIGDPMNGKIFMAVTVDGGNTWRSMPEQMAPSAEPGEAMFASSGTNIRALGKNELAFITGGTYSRLFIRNDKFVLPLLQGKETTGANSIAAWDKKTFTIVGGDFTNPKSTEKNCVLTKDAGKTFIHPTTPPFGYRSCVEYLSKSKLITCGISGVDISEDGGMNWRNISAQGFHVVQKAKKGKAVFLAGGKGRIAKLVW